nr:hypothetical protein [Desulfobacula sp.]
MKPQEIEDLSFKIIDAEAGPHSFGPSEWPVVRRMIHTSADFEYMNTVRFHPKAVRAGIEAIRSGCRIFTDTRMAGVGIRKKEIQGFGGEVICLMADEAVARAAKVKLKMITNRGVKVYPGGFPETFRTDHWRCRFVATEPGANLTPLQVIGLLAALNERGYDFIKTEHLFTFDAPPATASARGNEMTARGSPRRFVRRLGDEGPGVPRRP